SGSFAIVLRAQDSWNARVATAPTTIAVAPGQVTITTTTLPPGSVRAPYSAALAAVGGTGAGIWSVASGALPAGIALSASGIISGTPTAVGTATFVARVDDAGWPGNTATQQL